MEQQASSVSLTPRRRTSILSRSRPTTSYAANARTHPARPSLHLMDAPPPPIPYAGSRGFDEGEDDLPPPFGFGFVQRAEEEEGFQENPVEQGQLKRMPSKSFSSLRTGAHEFGSLVRKMSQSLRPKASKYRTELSSTSNNTPQAQDGNIGPISRSKTSWFRQGRSMRRPSLPFLNGDSEQALTYHTAPRPSFMAPVPGTGPNPPIVPQDMNNGAAARAAAAAQNEALSESTRLTVPSKAERRLSDRIMDLKLTRDSESGIGIDLRDQSETNLVDEHLIRMNPSNVLPPEIMAQIFGYLDPTTLMSAELACRAWNIHASSKHVWRHTFRRAYSKHRATGPASARLPAAGLGKQRPDQNWKRMYMVRRALEQRWEDGQAAAIYLNGHKDSVYCVQFDEHKIITGSRDQTIRIWDARTYQCLKIIGAPISHGQHHLPPTWTPPLSQNGLVPMCTINTSSRAPTGRKNSLSPAELHKASILCLQFDDEIMVTGSSDATCIVWSVADNYTPICRLRGHTAGVLDVCFDHRYIVTCSKDTTICVWDRNSGDLLKRLNGHRGPVNAVQLKGDLLVSASGDGIAKLWNLTSGVCVKEFPSRDRGLACVEFSDDGKTILAGGNDQVIYQFDANTGELVRELKGHKGLVRSLHLDTVNKRIVSGSYDMSIKVWDADKSNDVNDSGLKLDFEGWTTSWMLAAKSDYRRVVATSQDGRAVILDFGYGLDGVELLEA